MHIFLFLLQTSVTYPSTPFQKINRFQEIDQIIELINKIADYSAVWQSKLLEHKKNIEQILRYYRNNNSRYRFLSGRTIPIKITRTGAGRKRDVIG